MNPNITNLDYLKSRCMGLHGLDADGEQLAKSIQARLEEVQKRDQEKAKEFMIAAYKAGVDSEPFKQLNELRLIQVGLYLMPQLEFAKFFEVVTLGESDQAYIYNDTPADISVGYIGQENRPRLMRVEPDSQSAFVPMNFLSTERVRYRTMDIYRGRIDAASKRLFQLAWEMANKMDDLALTLMTATVANGGAFGAFVTTGTKKTRTYIAKSRILSEHLKATNDIDVGTPSSATKFSFSVLDEIVDYGNSWGNAMSDGPLRPTGEVLVPASEIKDIASTITPIGEANNVTEQIRNQGYITGVNYMGIPWTFTPSLVIPKGRCYPRWNKPAGYLFLKPSMDKDRTRMDDDENWAEDWQVRAVGMAIPETRRPNLARFRYYIAP